MSGRRTTAVHADEAVRAGNAIAPAIYQTATFSSDSAEEFAYAAREARGPAFYTRYGNPNHVQAASVVAELEGAEVAMVTSSGMGALTTTALALVRAGDHVIAQRSTYGGTASLVSRLLPRLGVECTQVDQTDVGEFERALRPSTRLVLLETPSNPLLEVTDLRAVASLARSHGALSLADNTFASPVNQQPLALGVDLVVHSATKYLGGHSDLVAGVVAGPAELLDPVWETALVTGTTLGPFDAWLLLRGIRTLPLRVAQQNANALAVASALEQHPAVATVHYPGLASHPQHELAAAQMTGFGGVLSVDLRGGYAAADAFISALEYAQRAPSLGGVETLVVHPAAMWGATMSDEQLAAAGIGPGLVRIAVGIEDEADLVEDMLQAVEKAR